MHITHEIIKTNYIDTNDSEDIFFDCEPKIEWPYSHDEIKHAATDITGPASITLTDDIMRSLTALLNIAVTHEANRFSVNMGWGIPQSVLDIACSIYLVVKKRENITTILEASLPLCVQAIISHSQHLTVLSVYLKDFIEEQLGPTLTSALSFGMDNIVSENGYLFLGVLALVGKYYCQGWQIEQPQRRYLNLPATLAGLFTTACRCWHRLCAASAADARRSTDDFGRLFLDQTDKARQADGRMLARQWARQYHNNQLEMERAAERYYGFSAPVRRDAVASRTTSRAQIAATTQAPPLTLTSLCRRLTGVREYIGRLPGALPVLPALLRLAALNFSLRGALNKFSLPSFSLLPMAAANSTPRTAVPKKIVTALAAQGNISVPSSDTLVNHYLQDALPTIKKIVGDLIKRQVKSRFKVDIAVEKCWLQSFDSAYPDPGSITGWSHVAGIKQSVALTDYAIKNIFHKEQTNVYALDKYAGLYYTERPASSFRHQPQVALKPSHLLLLTDNMDVMDPYIEALDGYWRQNQKYHCIANIINILSHLHAEQHLLSESIVAIILHSLGLAKDSQYQATVRLFDINGYQATDMLVFYVSPDNTAILYLPRGPRRFRVFDGIESLRRWVITQCHDAARRNEIARHFTLQDRMDGASWLGFGTWGVDRWLAHIADYPERILQLEAPLTAPLYEVLGSRQRTRSFEDAAKLDYAGRQELWTLAGTAANITDSLLAPLLIPFVAWAPEKDTVPGANNLLPMLPHAGAQVNAVNSALVILTAILTEIIPRDDNGNVNLTTPLNFTLAEYFHIVKEDIALWKTMPDATAGEKRLIARLGVYPQGYMRVMHTNQLGTTDSRFTIRLAMKNGRHRDNVPAIRMYNTVLPLRHNKLRLWEVYDIHHTHRPGYPVHMVNIHEMAHWQFGRVTDFHFKAIFGNEVAMADYAFVSVRLFALIMENIDNLCCKVRSLTPINSQGMAQDSQGNRFLKIGIHYIKIENSSRKDNYILGNRDAFHLAVVFNTELKKFVLSSQEERTLATLYSSITTTGNTPSQDANMSLSYRDGSRGNTQQQHLGALVADKIMFDAGVEEILCFGLSPQEILAHPNVLALTIKLKDAMASCRHIIMDVLYASEREERKFVLETISSLIKIRDSNAGSQEKILRLVDDILEKMLDFTQQHIDDKFSRVWLARSRQPEAVILAVHGDPLKRIWVNAGYNESAAAPARINIRFCRYGCQELSPIQDIAILERNNGDNGNPGREDYAERYSQVNFPATIERLWAGKMTHGEINFLISLPQANQIDNYFLMTDRELARQMFRKKTAVRIAMIARNADLFCQLLVHLHRAMNTGQLPARYHQDPWLMSLLFSAAFHTSAPATSAPARS